MKGYVTEMKQPFLKILSIAKLGFKKVKIFDDQKNFLEISNFLNVFLPIMYEFVDYSGVEENHPLKLIPTKDFEDIKFATIEFLYYFLKEDFDLVKQAEKMKSKIGPRALPKKRSKPQMKVEYLGREGAVIRECRKIYVK